MKGVFGFLNSHAALRRFYLFSIGCIALGVVGLSSTSAHAVDFQLTYRQGKLFLKQKLFFDAVKAFHQVITQTARGKRHFGAHFYLAQAYSGLPISKKLSRY